MAQPGTPQDRSAAEGTPKAASELRATAKWLVGGAIASSAGVFTGSTLSRFGHLPLDGRFFLALAGLLIGFAGAGWLLSVAMNVMGYDAVSYTEIAEADGEATAKRSEKGKVPRKTLLYVKGEIDRLSTSWPHDLQSFKQVHQVWKARRWGHRTVAFYWETTGKDPVLITDWEAVKDKLVKEPGEVVDAKLEVIEQALDEAMRAARFFKVQHLFGELRARIPWQIALMVLGFGTFAWAANPPDPPSRPPAVVLHWPSS